MPVRPIIEAETAVSCHSTRGCVTLAKNALFSILGVARGCDLPLVAGVGLSTCLPGSVDDPSILLDPGAGVVRRDTAYPKPLRGNDYGELPKKFFDAGFVVC
jgi:hypothetical protein